MTAGVAVSEGSLRALIAHQTSVFHQEEEVYE
jgi:hypothetical protein